MITFADPVDFIRAIATGSCDPDGTIVRHVWEWSDGVVAEGRTISRHIEWDFDFHHPWNWEFERTYTVTLTV